MAIGIGRRRLLGFGVAAIAAVRPFAANALATPRSLSFENLHTGEKLAVTYWANGRPIPEAKALVDHILRDYRTGDVHPIDPGLLDLLHRLHQSLGTSQPFQVISGYRSPRTNAMLADASGGVARKSLHMQGLAIDIRVPGRPLATVRDAAAALQGGGVGFYPRSDFVHVDVGRVRSW